MFQKGVKNSSIGSLILFLLLPTSGWSRTTTFRITFSTHHRLAKACQGQHAQARRPHCAAEANDPLREPRPVTLRNLNGCFAGPPGSLPRANGNDPRKCTGRAAALEESDRLEREVSRGEGEVRGRERMMTATGSISFRRSGEPRWRDVAAPIDTSYL